MISHLKCNKNFWLLGVAAVFYGSALVVHRSFDKPHVYVSKQDSTLNFNPIFLKIFSVGNKMLLSDFLWVQTLMESDLEHYQRKDLGSWMFLRFNSIATLDPYFYENYLYGGQYLSIIKDDLEGAAKIYEQGLKIYPNDYALNYNAGFNYYFEMGDLKKGLSLLEKIVNHPKAPIMLPSIVNKLRLANGVDIQTVYNFAKDRLQKTDDPKLKEKLAVEIYSIKAEKDLTCLNEELSNECDRFDEEGKPYIKTASGYVTYKPIKPYRLKDKIVRKKK